MNMSGQLIFLESLVFIGSFLVSWLLRKVLGRMVRGWKVGLWGLLFGLVGGILTLLGLQALSSAFQIEDLGNGVGFALVAIRYFGLTALSAGFIGAVVASFGPRKKKPLPPEPPQHP